MTRQQALSEIIPNPDLKKQLKTVKLLFLYYCKLRNKPAVINYNMLQVKKLLVSSAWCCRHMRNLKVPVEP